MTNKEKALALIGTFRSGDTRVASSLLAEGYIQHNLSYGTGRDAFISSVEYLASAPVKTTVKNIRAFEDGDKVFLQTVYNFAGAGEQVAFDIFRFDENGKIAEHWDNLASLAAPNPSGHTQIDGYMAIEDIIKTEENRKVVENFLIDVMQGKHPEKTDILRRLHLISMGISTSSTIPRLLMDSLVLELHLMRWLSRESR